MPLVSLCDILTYLEVTRMVTIGLWGRDHVGIPLDYEEGRRDRHPLICIAIDAVCWTDRIFLVLRIFILTRVVLQGLFFKGEEFIILWQPDLWRRRTLLLSRELTSTVLRTSSSLWFTFLTSYLSYLAIAFIFQFPLLRSSLTLLRDLFILTTSCRKCLFFFSMLFNTSQKLFTTSTRLPN